MHLNLKKYFLLIPVFLSAYILFAREVTIIVTDADLHLPLEGATVRSRDIGDFICDSRGRVVITVPEDRQIVLQVVYPGYETGIITVSVTGNSFSVALHLSGHMMGRELVVEASKPGSSETRTGRSVAVSAKEITQTGEIGIIEDVMSTISLLPGVSYKGFLDSEPSIRGGYPGDMSASLNGFYINNPFFWGGTFSIFDPRMVESAQLSHGVFSVRYGHTISGLLEVTSRNPSPTETQFELGANTSAANFNLSLPLSGKGGLLFMGRITYYDPILALATELSDVIPELAVVSSFDPVPHIRTVTANGSYRFTDKLELSATGFFGLDGVGVKFNNDSDFVNDMLDNSQTNFLFLFNNYQAFFTSSLSWNPRRDMLLKFLIGTGYEEQINKIDMMFDINREFSPNGFYDDPHYGKLKALIGENTAYSFFDNTKIDQSESNLNLQGRIDYDWHLSEKFLISAGMQTMYNYFTVKGTQETTYEFNLGLLDEKDYPASLKFLLDFLELSPEELYIARTVSHSPKSSNNLLTSSGYILGEYSLGNSFNAELGIRVDHFLLTGKNNLRLDSDPAINPRLNLEFNLLNSTGLFQKIDLSLGTGLFSSINNNVFSAEKKYYKDNKITPNRSWTSLLGFKFEFPESISVNIEGYYKYIYDRMYVVMETINSEVDVKPYFNGIGNIWGIDIMLQKIQSRYWDGWLSYSFSWTKYKDPNGSLNVDGRSGGDRGDDWYYPSFHRFHTLNLVFNYKPVQSMNLYMRLGFASGVPLSKRSDEGPKSYPVYYIIDTDDFTKNFFIEKYKWDSYYDENNRTTPSLNLDLKFSIFGGHKTGKTRYELYIAIENVLGLLYTAQGNTSFNQYTGEPSDMPFSATYDIPIPIPSFGFKISY